MYDEGALPTSCRTRFEGAFNKLREEGALAYTDWEMSVLGLRRHESDVGHREDVDVHASAKGRRGEVNA